MQYWKNFKIRGWVVATGLAKNAKLTLAKTFKLLPKWQNSAKSGDTDKNFYSTHPRDDKSKVKVRPNILLSTS